MQVGCESMRSGSISVTNNDKGTGCAMAETADLVDQVCCFCHGTAVILPKKKERKEDRKKEKKERLQQATSRVRCAIGRGGTLSCKFVHGRVKGRSKQCRA